MKLIHKSCCIAALAMCSLSAFAQNAGDSVMLQYGTVEAVKVVKNDGKRAAGTAIGGIAGAAIAKDHRGLGMIAGGLLGGGIE